MDPPEPLRVARRALVLAAVSCRSSLELSSARQDAASFHRSVISWCQRIPHLIDEFEPEEWALVAADLGSLTTRAQVNASWRAEGLAVLAWALSRYEPPDFEHQVDPPAVGNAIDFLAEGSPDILVRPAMRPYEEIEAFADEVLAWHWRLRQYSVRPEHVDFRRFAGECTWADMPVDRIPLIDADLAIGGVSIARAPEGARRQCLSIVWERHQAANWLLGYERTYSLVTTDT